MRTKWYLACAITAFALYYAIVVNPAPSRPYACIGWKPGDIIFVEGRSFRSSIVRFLEFERSDYSHVGFIVFNRDVPFVIHADPQRGRVVKERWDLFLSPDRVTGDKKVADLDGGSGFENILAISGKAALTREHGTRYEHLASSATEVDRNFGVRVLDQPEMIGMGVT
jgi:hypothetical protein